MVPTAPVEGLRSPSRAKDLDWDPLCPEPELAGQRRGNCWSSLPAACLLCLVDCPADLSSLWKGREWAPGADQGFGPWTGATMRDQLWNQKP